MRLGTRWAAGTVPPASVPDALRPEIEAVDAALPPGGAAPSWTLTWLEGRPVAELDAGIEVTLDAAGRPVSRPFGGVDG